MSDSQRSVGSQGGAAPARDGDVGTVMRRRLPGASVLIFGCLALLVSSLGVLGPVLRSGYIGDDAINFLLPDLLEEAGRTSWDHIREINQEWIRNQGRLFPTAVVQGTTVFHLFTSRSSYKAYQFTIVLVCLVALVIVVRRLVGAWHLGLLAGLITLTSMQFRLFHDGILSFSGLLSFVVLMNLCTLLAGLAYLRTGHRRWLPVAAACWVMALTSYELTYLVTGGLLTVVALTESSRRRRLVVGAIVLVPTIVLAMVVRILRSNAAALAPSYTVNLALSDVLPTTIYQFLGAVPGNVPAFRADPGLGALMSGTNALTWIIAAVAGGASGALAVQAPSTTVRSRVALATLGLNLWMAPALTVGVTLQWQQQLGFGVAYLGVVMQSFGVGLVAVAAFASLRASVDGFGKSRQPLGRIAIGALAALVAVGVFASTAATSRNNQWVVDSYAAPIGRLQTTVERAALSGLYTDLESTSLVPANQDVWLTPTFLRRSGAELLGIEPIGALATATVNDGCSLRGGQVFQPAVGLESDAPVVLARPDVVLSSEPVPIVGTRAARVFVPGVGGTPRLVAASFGVAGAPPTPIPQSDLQVRSRTARGMVVELCVSAGLLDAATITVAAD